MQIICCRLLPCKKKELILSWFCLFDYTKNVKYAWDGKLIQVSVCQKLLP